MKLLRLIDDLLNKITMYRLVMYGLGLIAAAGIIFAYAGTLLFSGNWMLAALAVLLVVCYTGNKLLAYLFSAPTNAESALITALILFCILAPAESVQNLAMAGMLGLIAMASKYLIAWRRKHLFNPAALAAVVAGFFGILPATWWIGTAPMLPLTAIVGLLIMRKTRRYELILAFVATALLVMVAIGLVRDQSVAGVLAAAFTSWPLVFFATVMLTEPSTLPPRRNQRLTYAVIVGALFSSQLHWGIIATTPEVVLLAGNIYSYAVSPKLRLRLKLIKKVQLSERVYDFHFMPDRPIKFLSGQYLEWTLPHQHQDGRGNRRTFSIASSPTESGIGIGVKFYEPASSFKRSLRDMQTGSYLMAGNLAGEFILPRSKDQKLLFVAGGIGITPFRSMLKYLIDKNESRDIVLLYSVSSAEEVSYKDILDEVTGHGVKVVKLLDNPKPEDNWDGLSGRLTRDLISAQAQDVRERTCYISGPPAMVRHCRVELKGLGIKSGRIKTDFFSGY